MARLLDRQCPVCGSWRWCGRICVSNGNSLDHALNDELLDAIDQGKTRAAVVAIETDSKAKRRAYMREYQRKRRAVLANG